MSAIPTTVPPRRQPSPATADKANARFLKLLPAVQTHAAIQFRDLPDADREEAVAEATAAAFVNYDSARRRGKLHRLTPSTVAKYAVLHAKTGRHVGGPDENTTDVMSRRAQTVRGFKCHSIYDKLEGRYDCMDDPTAPVWKLLLSEHGRNPVADLACFRIDWSDYLKQQHDRTRQAISMLAEGYKRCEVADRLGTTPPAVTQRMSRAEHEWRRFEG